MIREINFSRETFLIYPFKYQDTVSITLFTELFHYTRLSEVPLYPIYPTTPLGQDMTQGQFLSGV